MNEIKAMSGDINSSFGFIHSGYFEFSRWIMFTQAVFRSMCEKDAGSFYEKKRNAVIMALLGGKKSICLFKNISLI